MLQSLSVPSMLHVRIFKARTVVLVNLVSVEMEKSVLVRIQSNLIRSRGAIGEEGCYELLSAS